jgi:hypothetical protein
VVWCGCCEVRIRSGIMVGRRFGLWLACAWPSPVLALALVVSHSLSLVKSRNYYLFGETVGWGVSRSGVVCSAVQRAVCNCWGLGRCQNTSANRMGDDADSENYGGEGQRNTDWVGQAGCNRAGKNTEPVGRGDRRYEGHPVQSAYVCSSDIKSLFGRGVNKRKANQKANMGTRERKRQRTGPRSDQLLGEDEMRNRQS